MSKWDSMFYDPAILICDRAMMARRPSDALEAADYRTATFTGGDLCLQVFSYEDGFTLASLHSGRALIYQCTGDTLDQAMERVEARMIERSAK